MRAGAQVRSGSGDKNKFQSDQSDNEPIPKNSLAQTTARYARVPDYHKAIKKQLNDILAWHTGQDRDRIAKDMERYCPNAMMLNRIN